MFPSRQQLPDSVNHVEGGLILELPETDVENYLKEKLDLKWMKSDEELINSLETLIEVHLQIKKTHNNPNTH